MLTRRNRNQIKVTTEIRQEKRANNKKYTAKQTIRTRGLWGGGRNCIMGWGVPRDVLARTGVEGCQTKRGKSLSFNCSVIFVGDIKMIDY